MSWAIQVFENKSRDYELLEKMALMLSFKSPNRWRYIVADTYFDFGQNWSWTTVLCRTGERGMLGSYQALSPAMQEKVLMSDGSVESMAELADEVFNGKFCPDKKKEVA